MPKFLALGALIALVSISSFAADWAPEEFEELSGPASPRVAMALRNNPDDIEIALQIDPAGAPTAKVEIGAAAAKSRIVVASHDFNASKNAPTVIKISASDLVSAPADWERLRIGVAVSWAGGPGGTDRLRERFRHVSRGAPHAGLSQSPDDWAPLNLTEHTLAVTDRKNKLWISFDQPIDGKATIVIENEKGERVRNLLAGQPFGKGAQRVEWDGLDENGKVVAPGTYRWRSAHHPGIKPNYLFSFCNDGNPPWRTGSGTDMWGPDHSLLLAAAANSEFTFLGGACAESGYAMVAVDHTGTKRMHYNPVMGTGIYKIALAADDTYLYAFHDGFAWGQKIDRKKPDWSGKQSVTLTRFDVKTGKNAEYQGKKFLTISSVEIGPGSPNKEWTTTTLTGAALLNGKLYVGDALGQRLVVIDPTTCAVSGELKLKSPGPLASYGAELLAVSEGAIVRVDPASGATKPFISGGALKPSGITADSQQNVFVSDLNTHTVQMFDKTGKLVKQIGSPGGPYSGTYDAQRMITPQGLAVAGNGWLWVCEGRDKPKRASAWDVASGKIVKEKWGPTAYGASGAGFDPQDHTRWIGMGAQWALDLEKKSSAVTALLQKEKGDGSHSDGLMNYRIIRQDGRTFLVGVGYVTEIGELQADGSLKPLVMVGSAHRFAMGHHWEPPAVFIEAFMKAYPDGKLKYSDKGPAAIWADRNGDGEMQIEEFDFSTAASNCAGAYWGHWQSSLALNIPATVNGKRVRVVLKPDGFYPGGAPKYPIFNDAIAAAVPIDLPGNEVETTIDRFGRMICNSDPNMRAFNTDGTLAWSYPNRWSNVHGSHNAPLPEAGVMQGSLFFLGTAPLDDKADVMVINGNHGRFFVVTSDGFYLDEMFKDVRMGGTLDAYLIGGECFGGSFNKSEKDGNYYLQSGHTDYRIFRLDGFKQFSRAEGLIKVRPEQVVAAERAVANRLAKTSAKKEGAAISFSTAPKIDGKDDEWSGAQIAWDKSGQFQASARIGYDAQNLYLYYNISDSSPWVNNGNDWTLLFKTGDSVDLQIAADASANPARSQPVPGDERILIAPFEGKNIAVLYRHRLGGAKDNPVTFNCPWRSESVDSVKKLENAKIAVKKENNRYQVEASIPLADLDLAKAAGKSLKADVGVIFGDPGGTINMLRSYWSNQSTGLVNDVPGEIMLSPNQWGTLIFQDSK